MSTSTKKMLQAAAGGGGADKTYVEDVFSTYLYTGTGGSPGVTITNGVNLADEGGLVWLKSRSNAVSHALFDTDRGSNTNLQCDNTNGEGSLQMNVYGSDAFNTDGFGLLSANGTIEATGYEYGSWTFRKAPGFFDIVTYTGDGTSARNINHNLGCLPACIMVKRLDLGGVDWQVWHRYSGLTYSVGYLNDNGAWVNTGGDNAAFFDAYGNSTQFTLGKGSRLNDTNEDTATYVAYLFAGQDDSDSKIFGADSDESIIKCGIYTGNGSTTGPEIDLGWEPQWLMLKGLGGSDWLMADIIRGLPVRGDGTRLNANLSNAEYTNNEFAAPQAEGFQLTNSSFFNTNTETYIYVAIRRPMKVPEAATDVFAVATRVTGNPNWTSNFVVDAAWQDSDTSAARHEEVFSRLTGRYALEAGDDGVEYAAGTDFAWDFMEGWRQDGSTSSVAISWMWQRAPGFMDVVTYTGNGVAGRTVAHNLTVAPEMMMVKRRDVAAKDWAVYYGDNTDYLKLNTDSATSDDDARWNDTSPTSTVFTVGAGSAVNLSSNTYIAYLFATLDGISKVGSYTADGTLTTIDCGFSAGARFILIKRTDASGDWYLYDSVRGITAGNDPYLIVNTQTAEVTGTDYIDPDNSGFQITAAGSSTINIDTGEYIFLAFA